MTSQIIVSKLSSAQRRLLISHIERPQRIERQSERADAGPRSTLASLMRAGFLQGYPIGSNCPKKTVLTDAGRRTVARILAEYAEALIAAGCLEIDPTLPAEDRPIRMLARIKTRRHHIRGLETMPNIGENIPRKPVDNP